MLFRVSSKIHQFNSNPFSPINAILFPGAYSLITFDPGL